MITIYTTTTCAQCKMVKKFFNIKNIQYEEINLDDHKDIAETLYSMGLARAPITTNKERSRYVMGYKPGELIKLLEVR